MSLLNLVKEDNIQRSYINGTLGFIEIANLLDKKDLNTVPNLKKSLPMEKKFLIAFEGINCCGKSTQIDYLKKYLNGINQNTISIRDDDNACWDILSKIGKGVYLLNKPLVDNFLWSTYFIDQYKNNLEIVKENVAVFDRYKLSVQTIQKALLEDNNYLFNDQLFFKDALSSLPEPDVGIYIDIPIDIMRKRYQKRGCRCSLKSEDLELTIKIKEIFRDLSQSEGYFIVDGTKSPECISREINDYILIKMEEIKNEKDILYYK